MLPMTHTLTTRAINFYLLDTWKWIMVHNYLHLVHLRPLQHPHSSYALRLIFRILRYVFGWSFPFAGLESGPVSLAAPQLILKTFGEYHRQSAALRATIDRSYINLLHRLPLSLPVLLQFIVFWMWQFLFSCPTWNPSQHLFKIKSPFFREFFAIWCLRK